MDGSNGNSWSRWLLTILLNVIGSCCVSIVLFVAIYSVVTQQFPPRFSQMKNSLEAAKQLVQAQQEKLHSAPPANDETMIAELEKSTKKKQRLGSVIEGEDAPIKKSRRPAADDSDAGPYNETDETQRRLNQAERLIMQLQNRVENLNNELQALKEQNAKK